MTAYQTHCYTTVYISSGTVINSGTITSGVYGLKMSKGAALFNTALVSATAGVYLDGASIVISGTIIGTSGGNGAFLHHGGDLIINTGYLAGDAYGILVDSTAGNGNNTGIGLVLSDGASTITLDFTGSCASDPFVVSNTANGTEIERHVLCLVAGTPIATPDGATRVEHLAIGDEVVTARGVARVRWVGRRSYDGAVCGGHGVAIQAGSISTQDRCPPLPAPVSRNSASPPCRPWRR